MTGRPQSGLAVLYATTGRQDEARKILGELERIAATKYMAAEDIAAVYVALGEKEEAYKWLERAWADHGGAILAVPIRPVFRPLHSDARFQAMVRRLGLDPGKILKPGK
jgi:tetratricopeptide (TPR) repeat protein